MGGNKNKFKKENSVRTMEEISKEYSDLVSKLGQATYTSYAYSLEVKKLNDRLVEVNQEASKRQELEALAKRQLGGSENVQSNQSQG